VNVLLKSDIDQQRVCTVQPLGVTENTSFVVDIDTVHFDDLKQMTLECGLLLARKGPTFASPNLEL